MVAEPIAIEQLLDRFTFIFEKVKGRKKTVDAALAKVGASSLS